MCADLASYCSALRVERASHSGFRAWTTPPTRGKTGAGCRETTNTGPLCRTQAGVTSTRVIEREVHLHETARDSKARESVSARARAAGYNVAHVVVINVFGVLLASAKHLPSPLSAPPPTAYHAFRLSTLLCVCSCPFVPRKVVAVCLLSEDLGLVRLGSVVHIVRPACLL